MTFRTSVACFDMNDPLSKCIAEYSAMMRGAGPGTELCTQLRDQMMNDPLVVANAEELLQMIPRNGDQVDIIMRVACKRVLARTAAQEKKQSLAHLQTNPLFGMF